MYGTSFDHGHSMIEHVTGCHLFCGIRSGEGGFEAYNRGGGPIPVRADLHGTTLSHAICLRQVYDMNRFV